MKKIDRIFDIGFSQSDEAKKLIKEALLLECQNIDDYSTEFLKVLLVTNFDERLELIEQIKQSRDPSKEIALNNAVVKLSIIRMFCPATDNIEYLRGLSERKFKRRFFRKKYTKLPVIHLKAGVESIDLALKQDAKINEVFKEVVKNLTENQYNIRKYVTRHLLPKIIVKIARKIRRIFTKKPSYNENIEEIASNILPSFQLLAVRDSLAKRSKELKEELQTVGNEKNAIERAISARSNESLTEVLMEAYDVKNQSGDIPAAEKPIEPTDSFVKFTEEQRKKVPQLTNSAEELLD